MKQIYHTSGIARLKSLAIIMLVMGLFAGHVSGQVSGGLKLDLYADEKDHPQLRFALGQDKIQITIVVKNDTPWAIYTDRGFSPAGLHRALILTDPKGVRHAYSEAGAGAFDVLPGISWNQIMTTEAQILASNWARSVIIEDLKSLFPMLDKVPGWYVIEAQLPFVRFAWAVNVPPLGILAPQKDLNNWYGTIDSNRIQIYVEPALGAQLQAQVLDSGVEPSRPIAQVPVRVFKKDDISAETSSQQIWDKTPRVLEGATSPQGWAVWNAASDVQCLPEAEYVVMAHYLDQYEQSPIGTGAEAGWAEGCQGEVVKELYFGAEVVPEVPGDLDGDGDVDRNDLNDILAARNTPASGPDDPRDIDSDGMITALDARKLVLLCTRPRCAVE
jgi:hypothetical protein